MSRPINRRVLLATLALLWVTSGVGIAQLAAPAGTTNEIRIVELQGSAEVLPAGASTWVLTQTNQALYPRDHLRTGTNSRVALRWTGQSVVPIGALTEIEIMPPEGTDTQSGLRLLSGVISFFHRDQPGRIKVLTRGAAAGVEGTEFVLAASNSNGAERATLSVIDGRVKFGNELGSITLTNGEQAFVDLGQLPVRTPGFIVNNVLQWCFYYPAVLNPADLKFNRSEATALQDSLEAYSSGDLTAALAKYPAGLQPGARQQIYHAALLLSVGQSEQAEAELAQVLTANPPEHLVRVGNALRLLISAVKRQEAAPQRKPELSTELLARSYYEQSRATGDASLQGAMELAQQAAGLAPDFSFAWARAAELNFSFGRTREAITALEWSLAFAPRNAQALALRGFLYAAENDTPAARSWFERAIAVDPALGNAWLGRGLCRIRTGDTIGGQEDLLVAAALEPQRAELRSYLGKAFAETGNRVRAGQELELSKRLDPHDPTAWLYSALLNQERNRINEAIDDLEKSQELNDNRALYRSQLLLDQDRAVRSANLANLYQDAGMEDVSVREATRAVNSDLGNYSAHMFLANSFQAGLDDRISQRYETAAVTENLLANILAPVGAGTLSSTISRSEYGRFFEQNCLGIVSSTEYLSRGAWTESGAQFGTFDKWSYDFEWLNNRDPGQYRYNDFKVNWFQLQLKFALTPHDTVFARSIWYHSRYGDPTHYFDPSQASPFARIKEVQSPNIELGYHHEWSPGMHTLFLGGRLNDDYSFDNRSQPSILVARPDDPANPGQTILTGVQGLRMHEQFRSLQNIYSSELQQICQLPGHQLIVGGRYQQGNFRTLNYQDAPSIAAVFPFPPEPAAQQDISSTYKRASAYGYYFWDIVDPLQLIGGVVYDHLEFPENVRNAPLSEKSEKTQAVSPKAGVVWKAQPDTTVRFGFARSLAGESLEQSFQLEPPQLAGFVQSFRSIIPESVAGGNAEQKFETFGLAFERRFRTRTYVGLSAELLNSQVHRTVGAFDVLPDQLDFAIPSGLREHLDYQERSLLFTINQLVGPHWSLGLRYRVSEAELKDEFVDVPLNLSPATVGNFIRSQRLESQLHELRLTPIFNHPTGLFAGGEALWMVQDNHNMADENFWQFNAYCGYRFWRRQAEFTLGILNLFDQDYRINPLNLYRPLPRERTLAVQFRLRF